jgi:hypothetical protein
MFVNIRNITHLFISKGHFILKLKPCSNYMYCLMYHSEPSRFVVWPVDVFQLTHVNQSLHPNRLKQWSFNLKKETSLCELRIEDLRCI